MNLIKTVEKASSKAAVMKIVKFIGENQSHFDELVSIFLNGPYRTTQRAAWPLSYCVTAHPNLVRPHLKALIKNLGKKGIHDAVKRNTVRLLQFVDIPKSLHGITYQTCMNLLTNTKEAIAIRVFAMTVLANISHSHPELIRELVDVIEGQMPYGSAGFKSRGAKVLSILNKRLL